jgi:hypothetical protein
MKPKRALSIPAKFSLFMFPLFFLATFLAVPIIGPMPLAKLVKAAGVVGGAAVIVSYAVTRRLFQEDA